MIFTNSNLEDGQLKKEGKWLESSRLDLLGSRKEDSTVPSPNVISKLFKRSCRLL